MFPLLCPRLVILHRLYSQRCSRDLTKSDVSESLLCGWPSATRGLSGSDDHTLWLWDLGRNPIGEPFQGHQAWVGSVAFSPTGDRIVSGSSDQTLRLWDLGGNPIGEPFQDHQARVWSVAFSPTGDRIVSGSSDETIRIWDVTTGQCLRVIHTNLCGGLNITGVVGLTEAQKIALQAMGAVET